MIAQLTFDDALAALAKRGQIVNIVGMTGNDVKAIRKSLGLTQVQLGEWLLLSGEQKGHTVRMWEIGKRPVSGPVEVCLKAFESGYRPPHVAP